MQVMTVNGPIDAAALGITLPHEHVFLDLRNQFTEFDNPIQQQRSHEPLTTDNVEAVRCNPYAIRDNLLLDDIDLAVDELLAFWAAGGRTVVDCTSVGIHRDPAKLRAAATRTGLNIIAGCGYYTQDTHPAQMEEWSAEQVAEQIVRDLTEGIDGTSIRAGVIGEIGTSFPLHPWERKNLVAVALAFRQTGVAIQVHTYPWGKLGTEIVDILMDGGVDPGKIVICHVDVQIDLGYIRTLLARGVCVEFDNFGKEFNIDVTDGGFAGGAFARDADRVHAIKTLLDNNYERQILITNDICLKCMLHRFGGQGYDHILRNIVPMMLATGVDQATVDMFLRDNPRRLYGIA